MALIKLISNLTLDGDIATIGTELDVPTEQAEDLIGRGLALPNKGSKPTKKASEEVIESDGLEGLGLKELKELAAEKGVNIAGLTRKTDILTAVREG